MIAILAADSEWGIGKGGRLPWRLPGDLAYFKRRTSGGVIIMGRRTFESLAVDMASQSSGTARVPSPLPGRTNVVLTRSPGYEAAGTMVARSVDELIDLLRGLNREGEVFVCGGAEIYRLLMPYTDICLVTRVDIASGADTFFPVIKDEWSQGGDGKAHGFADGIVAGPPGHFTADTPDGAGRRFVLVSTSGPVTENDLLNGHMIPYRFCEYRAKL
ncbi:MAG: dihydrofolate reductase [Clostridiales Family XIII bacterium]|nr:dihydrofolate reductase [Clostridiales Family XIII bacterium]